MITILLRRLPDVEQVDADNRGWRPTFWLRALMQLPARW